MLFIVSIHACLAMFAVADITNTTGVYLETSGFMVGTPSWVVHQGNNSVGIPQSNLFFNSSANGTEIFNSKSALTGSNGTFVGKMIEQILGAADIFSKFINMFKNVLFSIHYLAAPIFGEFNGWVLEGMVDIVFGISLFQIVSGRSFKTME